MKNVCVVEKLHAYYLMTNGDSWQQQYQCMYHYEYEVIEFEVLNETLELYQCS